MNVTVSASMPLGIEGFSYADLHDALRLKDLHGVFCQEVESADPDLWQAWSAYAADPDAPPAPMVRMTLEIG